MAEIRTVRTARKTHRCGSETSKCLTVINPGDRYLLASLPPDSDMGNIGWWHLVVCRGCAEIYGQPIEDQVTPRRSTRARRRRLASVETAPSRPHVDEPRLDRPIVNVPLPALEATNA